MLSQCTKCEELVSRLWEVGINLRQLHPICHLPKIVLQKCGLANCWCKKCLEELGINTSEQVYAQSDSMKLEDLIREIVRKEMEE